MLTLTKPKKEIFLKEHVCYEIEMLIGTYSLLGSARQGGVMWNAITESFLIHFRCVYGFLYKGPKMNDVIAAHINNNWESNPSSVLKRFNTFADKSVAHLTADRFENKPAFLFDDFSVAYDLILRDINKFLNGLDSEYQKFEEILRIRTLLNESPTSLRIPIPRSAPTGLSDSKTL